MNYHGDSFMLYVRLLSLKPIHLLLIVVLYLLAFVSRIQLRIGKGIVRLSLSSDFMESHSLMINR